MRDVRSRQSGLMHGLDLVRADGPAQTRRQLVQVYNGGAIPTTTPRVFLTNPVVMDAADTEGASYAPTVDTGVTIPVVVLGPAVPYAGDLLVAHAIGGRWVTQRGHPRGADPCYVNCSPCGIPRTDLTLVVSPGGTSTLTFDGTSTWTDGTYTLACSGGTTSFTGGGTWALSSSTCNPFELQYGSGSTTTTITGPSWWPAPGVGGCVLCGSACAACGNVILDWSSATWTDDNGTGNVILYQMTPLGMSGYGSGYLTFHTQTMYYGTDSNGYTTCISGAQTLNYGYFFNCTLGGSMAALIWFPGQVCCISTGAWGFDPTGSLETAPGTIFPGNPPPVTPTCYSDKLEYTIPLPSGSGGVCGTMPLPSTKVTVTVPFAKAVPQICCSPCAIPKKDLTLSWLNALSGNGSTTLTYSAPGSWSAGCFNELLASLGCVSGQTQLCLTYFISGGCPNGQSQQCCSQGTAPQGLKLVDYTCNPLHLHYVTQDSYTQFCPSLLAGGYTDFFIDAA